ncbi:hypothetical protein MSIMFB_04967 [Mycobacterium simulans]|uniref:Uncharacterized protein n=1 Tax=Mycobacterium simulans TaxID=627089 RepID=A0A7Z7NC64_9MYCO|nr:hypothetical protein MSIMFB_04967 [Mycobacterium simulans]
MSHLTGGWPAGVSNTLRAPRSLPADVSPAGCCAARQRRQSLDAVCVEEHSNHPDGVMVLGEQAFVGHVITSFLCLQRISHLAGGWPAGVSNRWGR